MEWDGRQPVTGGVRHPQYDTGPKGQYLHVLLFLSANQSPIEVGVATVRWFANAQFGVEFMTLTSRDMTRLQDLLTILGA